MPVWKDFALNNHTGIIVALDKPENIKLIQKIIDLEKELYFIPTFLSYKFNSYSSGESAMLNIFSRLYSVDERKLNNNVILLMDEPELYLHPEWQRKFINFLTKFLKNNAKFKNKNIQVILSSNTPYLLSNIPIANVNFLECENDVKNRVIHLDTDIFGQNIHTLLKYNFFMAHTFPVLFIKNKRSILGC